MWNVARRPRVAMDQDLVREVIRHRLRERRLPLGRAVGIRETQGDGRPCNACEEPVDSKQRAVVVMVSREWMSVHFHQDCYIAWETERAALTRAEDRGGPA